MSRHARHCVFCRGSKGRWCVDGERHRTWREMTRAHRFSCAYYSGLPFCGSNYTNRAKRRLARAHALMGSPW